jgi:CheY-like chemotaxis protein
MALFNFSKEKRDSGSLELVLAYLEDLQRTRGSLVIQDANSREVPGSLATIDEENSTCAVQLNGPLPGIAKGHKVDILFMAEGLRIQTSARVSDVRGNSLYLDIPDELKLKERRDSPRAKLHAKEGATMTALTGLFEGIGLVGALENVSEIGARIRVEKAMNIQGEKKLPLGLALVQPGQEFMLVKLNQVPKCPPVMEFTGRVVYVEQSNGLFLGIKLDKPNAALTRLVSSRTGAIPSSVPPKARRRARPVVDEEEAFSGVIAKVQEPPKAVEPIVAPEPPPPPKEVEPSTPEVIVAAEPSPRQAAQPLLRLKKRSRAAVVLAPTGKAQFLYDALVEDGYGRILIASNTDEVREHLQQPNLGFLFMDVETSILDCLKFISDIRIEFHDLPPMVLASQDVSRALAIAAHRLGVQQLIVKPYVLDDGFFAILDGLLELA